MEVSGRKNVTEGAGSNRDVMCQPCHRDGENITAEGYCITCNEYFCSSCIRFHRKQSMSRNHVIKSKDEMPAGEVQTDPCLEPCTVHKTEIVKFYCKEHDFVGCGDCMVLDHKTCKVDLVQTVSNKYKDSKDLREIKQTLELLQENTNTCKQNIMHSLKTAPEMKKKTVEEIKLLRVEMNTYLDTAEAEILTQVEQMESEDLTALRKFKEECKSIEKELAEFQGKLKTQSEKTNTLFVTAKFAKKHIKHYQDMLDSMTYQSQIKNYHFEPSKDLLAVTKMRVPLGNITISNPAAGKLNEKRDLPKRTSDVDMKSFFVNSINVKASREVDCYISGLTMIASDTMLLADTYNSSLKIVNIERNTIISRYTPHAAPWDVTKISSDTAAATLPSAGKIIFLSTEKKLSKISGLDVRNGCRGIDYQNETLAVSFCHPPAVQLLDLNGEVLHEITAESCMFHEGSFPGHIAWSKDSNCYWLSDKGSNELSKVTMDGQRKFIVKSESMIRPRGLAVTRKGIVFVCYQDTSRKISIVSPDSKDVLSLELENVKTPHTILLCEKCNMLYITEYSTDCNVIKIFNLK